MTVTPTCICLSFFFFSLRMTSHLFHCSSWQSAISTLNALAFQFKQLKAPWHSPLCPPRSCTLAPLSSLSTHINPLCPALHVYY